MRTSIIVSLSLLASSLLACGGDELNPSEAAGAAGTAGAAGSAGAASGSAGTTTAGSGGTQAGGTSAGGSAGESTGGTSAGGAGGAGNAGAGNGGSNAGGAASGAGGQPGGAAGVGGAGAGGDSGAAGAPGECTLGEYSCFGDLLRICNENGEFEPKEACGTGLCSAEAKACLTCKPGDIKDCASPSEQSVCNEAGSAYEPVACSSALPFCLAGACVQCTATSDCKPSQKTCVQAFCDKNVCTEIPQDKDTPLPEASQIPNDCQLKVCDDKATPTSAPLLTDLPLDDGNDCTDETCSSDGQPSHPNLAVGTACGANGAGFCNGKGLCGVCIPGERRCTDNKVETCSDLGQWEASECNLPTQVCSAGACVGVSQVAAGSFHTCALLTDGRIKCWGQNNAGQLGNGESGLDLTTYRPVDVIGIDDATAIQAGYEHTCAIVTDGKVKCWGSNSQKQLGALGAPVVSTTPLEVTTLGGVQQLSLGEEFSCALSNKQVFCWGANDEFQSGQPNSQKPVEEAKLLATVPSAIQVTTGNRHACALTEDGKTYCWGSGNHLQHGFSGKFPFPPTLNEDVPKARSIEAGGDHTCAHLKADATFCWGRNEYAQLGTGNNTFPDAPEPIQATKFTITKEAKLVFGDKHSCRIVAEAMECVGYDMFFQLANGQEFQEGPKFYTDILKVVYQQGEFPQSPAPALTNVLSGSAGTRHTCALQTTGQLVCWGSNWQGQLGIPNQFGENPGVNWAKEVAWLRVQSSARSGKIVPS